MSSPTAIAGADKYLQQGDGFLKSVRGDWEGRQRFSGDMAFDLLSMAVENFLYAGCLGHGYIPANGCLIALSQEADEIMHLPIEALDGIASLVNMKDICSLFPEETPRAISSEEIPRMIGVAEMVRNGVSRRLESRWRQLPTPKSKIMIPRGKNEHRGNVLTADKRRKEALEPCH